MSELVRIAIKDLEAFVARAYVAVGISPAEAANIAELQVRARIREDIEGGQQKQQREYILRKQMESIRKELG